MLDIDSVSFLIKPAGIKKFVHSAITPSAYEHNPGQLDRISLAAGAQVQEAFKLPAATLGLWEITAYYQGSNKLFSAEPLKITIVPPKSDKPEKPTDGELIAKIETSKGTMKCRFFFNDAPNTVLSFLRQSKKGFYDNLTFHRIMKGFMIQGGDPNGNGSGGPGYCIKGEFNAHRHLRGTLSMARSSQNPPIPLDNDSAGCQFFICHDAAPKLDNQYTAFGELVEGTDVLDTIANIQTGPNPGNPKEMSKPMENVFIKSISLEFREMPSNK
ncbi:MAG: peptidylprolyl isomerase [Planctomycetes bacterium]|nr:peptidylprolyl isomerase [Planctomycetota bacterium]